jgi:hypothetical protein
VLHFPDDLDYYQVLLHGTVREEWEEAAHAGVGHALIACRRAVQDRAAR